MAEPPPAPPTLSHPLHPLYPCNVSATVDWNNKSINRIKLIESDPSDIWFIHLWKGGGGEKGFQMALRLASKTRRAETASSTAIPESGSIASFLSSGRMRGEWAWNYPEIWKWSDVASAPICFRWWRHRSRRRPGRRTGPRRRTRSWPTPPSRRTPSSGSSGRDSVPATWVAELPPLPDFPYRRAMVSLDVARWHLEMILNSWCGPRVSWPRRQGPAAWPKWPWRWRRRPWRTPRRCRGLGRLFASMPSGRRPISQRRPDSGSTDWSGQKFIESISHFQWHNPSPPPSFIIHQLVIYWLIQTVSSFSHFQIIFGRIEMTWIISSQFKKKIN